MALPVLLSVDDDGDALAHVEAQLLQRYGMEYRVESLGDAEEALRRLTDLARAGEEVALVLVGLRISDAGTGGELLERAREFHPDAKRALLVPPDVAWAERRPRRRSSTRWPSGGSTITSGGPLPHAMRFSTKRSPASYSSGRRIGGSCPTPSTSSVRSGRAGRMSCGTCSNGAPPRTRSAWPTRARAANCSPRPGPRRASRSWCFPTGPCSATRLTTKSPWPREPRPTSTNVLLTSSSSARVRRASAAVYGASEGRRTLVVDEGGIGGQARSSSRIRNYLGLPKGLSGARLAEQAHEQASVFGASFLFMHEATALEREGRQLHVSLSDGRRLSAGLVILATGASYRRLGVPSLEALNGAGVFYGGTASGAQGLTAKDVYVVGGGNSAGQAALHLARYAREVTMVVRPRSLAAGMSHYLVREIEATPNVRVRTGTTVVGGGGDGRLEELVLEGPSGQADTAAADALFVLIGARPHTEWLPGEIARDAHGFLLTGDELSGDAWSLERPPLSHETSMPGVLAAGDVRRGSVKRVGLAVGEGSIAIQLAPSLLSYERVHARPPTEAAARSKTAGGR